MSYDLTLLRQACEEYENQAWSEKPRAYTVL